MESIPLPSWSGGAVLCTSTSHPKPKGRAAWAAQPPTPEPQGLEFELLQALGFSRQDTQHVFPSTTKNKDATPFCGSVQGGEHKARSGAPSSAQ
jgi:hypothetical protein